MCAKNSFWNLRPPEWLQVTPWCFLRRVAKAMTVFGNSCQKTGEKGRARDSSTIYFDDDKANSSINFSTLCLLRAWIPWELCLAKIRTELHQMKNAESGLFFHRFYIILRRNKPFTVLHRLFSKLETFCPNLLTVWMSHWQLLSREIDEK